MFNSIKEVQQYVEDENVLNLDIRFYDGRAWNSIVFPVEKFDFSILENGFDNFGVTIENIDIKSAFNDVFLAHRTLVFFAKITKNDPIPKDKQIFKFRVVAFEQTDNSSSFVMNPSRDFLGELVLALISINMEILYYYQDEGDISSIVLKNISKYDEYKFLYAISMISKVYKVKIEL